jgi:very-short-patch-repair endonuclease
MEKARPQNSWHYNKKLKSQANALRKNTTKAEACLWKYALRAKQMRGYAFSRQRPVLNFIADFMCKELLLVIELDGLTHHDENTAQNDRAKEEALEDAGFYVLRFSDETVLNDIKGVTQSIENFIDQIEEKGKQR